MASPLCLIMFAGCVLATGLNVHGASGGVSVWAIGDGVRIDPESGKAFEDDPKVLPDGLKAGYRQRNWIWNGRTVQLHAARNEVVAFQIIIDAPKGASQVRLAASPLRSANGAVIDKGNVQMFREWYLHLASPKPVKGSLFPLRGGWYPDALIPLEASKHGAPFDIPSADFRDPAGAKPKQVNQAVWVDLYVPPNAKAGQYAGTITVTGRAPEPFRIDVPVRLDVWDFALPQENHYTFELMCYGDMKRRADALEYYRLAHAHRLVIADKNLTPELVNRGTPKVDFDWRQFDAKWSGLFDGTAFKTGPGAGVPVSQIILRFDHNWPGGYGKPDMNAAYKRLIKKWEEHFLARKWTKTRLIV